MATDLVADALRVADGLDADKSDAMTRLGNCDDAARLLRSLAAIVGRLPVDKNGTPCIPIIDEVLAPSGNRFVVLDRYAGDLEPFDPVLLVSKCERVDPALSSRAGGGA